MIQRYTPCPESSNLRLNSLLVTSTMITVTHQKWTSCKVPQICPLFPLYWNLANTCKCCIRCPLTACFCVKEKRSTKDLTNRRFNGTCATSFGGRSSGWLRCLWAMPRGISLIYIIYSLMWWNMSRTSDSPERRKPIGPDFARSLLQNLCIIKHLQV